VRTLFQCLYFIVLFLSVSLSAFAKDTGDINLDTVVPKFIKTYCIACHDSENEKGDRDFEVLLADSKSPGYQHTLIEILDQLNLGEMPPKKKRKQPSNAERRLVVEKITDYLIEVDQSKAAHSTVLRRLTRYEYNNTMRDLLGVHPDSSDATAEFPADVNVHGFVNVGENQVLSSYQLQHYMKAARRYLDQALVFDQAKANIQKLKFSAKHFNSKKLANGGVTYRVISKNQRYVDIGHGQPDESAPTYAKNFTNKGVSQDGYYRISIKAEAVGRKHNYDPKIFRSDPNQPLKMGVWHVPDKHLLDKSSSEGRVFISALELEDNVANVYGMTVWMPKGSIPYVHWINGESIKSVMKKVQRKYHRETMSLSQTDIDRLVEQGKKAPTRPRKPSVVLSDVYEGPRIRLYGMHIEGPLNEQWPPKNHRNIVGDVIKASEVNISKVFVSFARKAFRRPVSKTEVAHYINYTQGLIKEGHDHAEAIKLGLAAILTSPRFLFMAEGDAQNNKLLDEYELASRLSYTLWSSMPDDILLNKAAKGTLSDPSVLKAETLRLLQDERSKAFTQHFVNAWLRLDKLGTMPPGSKLYRRYYFDRLEAAMRTETEKFFDHILFTNKPLVHFIAGNYSFLNDNLAKHYGVAGEFDESFKLVALPKELRRGGLLGHASILTASANGIDTSPVLRGVWMLESMLGTPPSPPPPDIPPIEPDLRGTKTIRDQLAKHRSSDACSVCHNKIDPWGGALEYFDPIGSLRTNYAGRSKKGVKKQKKRGPIIDGSGELSTGELVNHEGDLKIALYKRQALFSRNLIAKLLTYSTGREMTYRDQAEIGRMVKQLDDSGNGMQDLLHQVVASDIFHQR